MPPRALYGAIALLSAGGIAYQIVLMRVFSIAQWHHFAYMIISIAMLGFGASGTVLSIARPRLAGREGRLLRLGAFLAALGFAGVYALSQQIPLETMALLNQRAQFWWLLLLYALLAVPFFLVACCITLGFFLQPGAIGRVYACNMAGSGFGALGVMGLLYALSPSVLPALVAALALVAWLMLAPWRAGRTWPAALIVAGLVLAAAWYTPVRVSQYKGMSYALQLPDATVTARAHSPLSEITAVASDYLRETPGQLSNYPMSELGELPPQIGLYFDAGPVSPVHQFDGNFEPFAFFDYVTGALPYRLVDRPSAVVIGPGGGGEVLNALSHGAEHVTAVETDPAVLELLRGPLREFSGAWTARDDVRVVVAEGRGFLEASRDEYDLILLPPAGSSAAAAAGVLSLSESYLYTTEALTLFLDRLSADGVLALNGWLQLPPRQAIKLFATAVEACERAGFEDPGQHLAFIRSWNTATIVVTRAPMSDERIAAVRQFCDDRYFDPCYYPGISKEEVNQYTQLDAPYYYDAARALLSEERGAYYRDYQFNVRPATDDKPYFFRFVRWEHLPRLWERGIQDIPFVEWGYLSLVATLIQGILASAVLILLPLFFLRYSVGQASRLSPGREATESSVGQASRLSAGREATGNNTVQPSRPSKGSRGSKWPAFVVFASLGFSFMFLEIAFIQIFMRFLDYPIYAVSVVLTAFLAFSGLGSLWAGTLGDDRRIPAVRGAVLALALLAVAYVLLLPPFFNAAAGWPDPVKIPCGVLLLAPLAFCMGVPFPAALQLLSDRAPALLPWAWGTNGCTSVTGATLATFIAVHAGFRVVILAALVLYGLVAWSMGALERRLGRAEPQLEAQTANGHE